MALVAGTAYATGNGAFSGGGLAQAIAEAMNSLFDVPSTDRGIYDAANVRFANVLAAAIINYLVANAVIQPGSMQAGGDGVTGTGTLS